ncbi:MAG: branched-chain amino acid ABC transporter permease [Bacteroidetes bacterium]|nr:branched-chain amino acid ABC transporter permease [Bacteroidota bacterium]
MMQIALNIVLTASLLSLVALSATLVYYTNKFFSLTQAASISFGAYFSFLFLQILHFPIAVSLLLGIICSVGIDLITERLVFRFMRNRELPPFTMLISSIGLYVVFQKIVFHLALGDDTKLSTLATLQLVTSFSPHISLPSRCAFFVSLGLFIVTNLFLQYTSIGKSIRAVASKLELCNIYGIDSNKIILIAFGIGSALAATSGILSAMDTNMTPTFGFNLLLYGVVAMIIGGVGSTRGLIVGALVATAQYLAAYCIDTKWMDAVTYIILILFLIWKPLGFSGKRLKKVET